MRYLILEPHLFGTGRGKQLWPHAVATASDQYAAPFYLAMGAVTGGQDGQSAAAHAGLAATAVRFALPASGA